MGSWKDESAEHDIAGTEMLGSVLTDFCHGGLDSAGKKFSSIVVLNKEIGVSRILATGDVLVRTGLDGHLGLIMQGQVVMKSSL